MAYRSSAGAAIDRGEDTDWPAPPAAPSIVPTPRAEPRGGPPEAAAALCPEIDCVRHLLSPDVAARAERRAIETDVGADRVLIAAGLISEEAYAASLARHLGVPFEPLIGQPRSRCPLPGDRLVEAARTGLLPLRYGDREVYVVAPLLVDSRRLMAHAGPDTGLAQSLRIATTARLHDFVARHGAADIDYRAADELREKFPEYSAGARPSHPAAALAVAILAAIALAALTNADVLISAVEVSLGVVFMAWTALRLFGLLSARPTKPPPRDIPDRSLPIYTIIVALYREATAVEGLARALRKLDYPAEKLDIKLVLEPDDIETQHAVADLYLGPPFETIIAPRSGPRTKPKALNAALPFARGAFVAIYDAEDRPEPDQLRIALGAFVAEDERLACVQARLTIDNTRDTWLTRLFTAEYAGLFDVFLPGLARWHLPLPLGGSSNHFRASVLRRLGAWDPYNVTEDADLGMRLARFGYRTAIIPSTTYEEAPALFGPWLKQRTRWFKGWMQTGAVHMRSPVRLARELGLAGFAVFQLVVGGTVLAALVHVLFTAQIILGFTTAPADAPARSPLGMYAALVLAGYAISALLGLVGLARRRLLHSAWVLLLIPVYWLLLSLAAWRALFQFLRDPYRWEKTEHGLARTSRLADRRQR